MSKTKAWLIILGSIMLLALEKTKFPQVGLIIEVPLLLDTLWLTIKYRKPIANWFKRLPLPLFLVALLSTFPFMFFEENMNCLPTGCQLIPPTIPILTVFMVVVLALAKLFKVRDIKKPLLLFAIFGVVLEMTYGAGAAGFRQLPWPWLVFIVLWVGISYIYIAVVPLEIIRKD